MELKCSVIRDIWDDTAEFPRELDLCLDHIQFTNGLDCCLDRR